MRYLLFAFPAYYPRGGGDDFVAAFDNLFEAGDLLPQAGYEGDGMPAIDAHVFDTASCAIIERYWREDAGSEFTPWQRGTDPE